MSEGNQTTTVRVETADRRRTKAAAALQRSNEKLVKLLAERNLAGDKEYEALSKRSVEVRAELHNVRLNLTKKGMRFRRLLDEVAELTDKLTTFHSLEVGLVEELERGLSTMRVKEAVARENAAKTL